MEDDCANPLWLGWMQEWLDTARERQMKTATVLVCKFVINSDNIGSRKSRYKKACDSLKNCPLILTHPSETQALHGFGPKICERLEQRMKQHCEENGLPMPKRKGRKRVSDALDEAALDMTPAKKPRKSKKPYVPQLRSGAYALILALASIDDSECVSKQQLIELAQPHCDSSFTVSKDTTSFYTAWNSMKTLVDKDMVKETSRPQRRYALTDDGWEVADKLKKVGKGNMEPPATSGPGEAAMGSRSRITVPSSDEDEIDPSANKPRVGKLAPLHDTSTIQSCAQGQKLGGGVIDKYGTLPSSKTHKIDKKPAAIISRAADRIGKVNANTEDDARLAARLQAEEDNLLASASDNLDFVQLLSSSPPKAPGLLRRQEPPVPPRIDRPSAKRDSASPPEMSSKPGSSTFVPPLFNSIHIQPRNFTVELVLDNREIRSREDRNYIEKELIIKGIRPTVRSLPLGDFFWVAKCTDSNLLARYGEEGTEIALDYIVERKRLDDLISSIKDGRFHEQKFRLRRSGVKNVVYLLEDIKISEETKTKYYEAVQSAIAGTQVVNGYFMKRTRGIDDTIRYLTRMTRTLKEMYESKPLTLLPSSILSPQTYLPLLAHLRTTKPNTSHNITYASFASLASKTDNLTLRDVFLQMLMTTRGLTGDKAIAIQRRWPTPHAFIQAYKKCQSEKEKETMVEKGLEAEVGRGKVGKALSKGVSEVWGVKG
ncbi:MAG: hypothetical protein Q9186_007413 [Xanthomendoza sp. 1 TL-2023]